MKAIVGIWKNDPCKLPQLYEFTSWGDALNFFKQNRNHFEIMYHFVIPEVLPF